MKTFFAVLAAGAIIFAAFLGWQRLDRWEQGKNYWIAELDHAHVNTSPVIPGLSSEDYQRQIDELDGQLKRRRTVAHELRLYLENKPFGLPLTDEENQLLKITGGASAESRKVSVQAQSTPTPTTDTPTPTPADTPTPTATDTPTPTTTPDFIVLTRPVPIKIPYGIISLNPGTRLKLLSRAATTVRVQYQGTDYDIPFSSTDLAK